jgi:hypothetical protein
MSLPTLIQNETKQNKFIYEGVSTISGTGAAICTAAVVARCNGT